MIATLEEDKEEDGGGDNGNDCGDDDNTTAIAIEDMDLVNWARVPQPGGTAFNI